MKVNLRLAFTKMLQHGVYAIFMHILGIFSLPLVLYNFIKASGQDQCFDEHERLWREAERNGELELLEQENEERLLKKQAFFSTKKSEASLRAEAKSLAREDLEEKISAVAPVKSSFWTRWQNAWDAIFLHRGQFILSLILSFPIYLMALLYLMPFARYVCERLFLMIFVIIGVTVLVFTLLYLSPMDPARNVLGELATEEQVAEFKRVYRLDATYLVQLKDVIGRLFTFDLGKSYVGGEDVQMAFMRKFPITLTLSFYSVLLAILIALPAGIFSAIWPNSILDYSFMVIAMLGLSIPNFWLGLILILNFSIRLHWLPASFVAGNWKTLIMPVIVLGTSMSAQTARTIRSSMLEVKRSGYIMTARAKGLSERKVIMRHMLGNALIPIVTIIGMQFGSMLGGAGVTEKVFNIAGIGSYIIDKQFIPDIPIVLAGVVYVALTISLANLFVDLLYAFIDPRIKSRLKTN